MKKFVHEDLTKFGLGGLDTIKRAQDSIENVIWVNLNLNKGKPEALTESFSKYNLIDCFIYDFFDVNIKAFKMWERQSSLKYNIKLIFPERKFDEDNLTKLSRDEFEEIVRDILGVDGERIRIIPKTSLFDIIIKEMISNARKYTCENGNIEISFGLIRDKSNLRHELHFQVENDVSLNKVKKSMKHRGYGTKRIKEVLFINLFGKSDIGIKENNYFSSGYIEGNSKKWKSWICFDFDLYKNNLVLNKDNTVKI